MAEVEEKVEKCKKYLEADLEDSKLLYVLKKLAHLEVTIDILQSTGIGKLVNSFRKRDGQVGEKARAIVNSWKKLVAAEAERLQEEEEEPAEQNSSSEKEEKLHDDGHDNSDETEEKEILENEQNKNATLKVSDHKSRTSSSKSKSGKERHENSNTENHRHSSHISDKERHKSRSDNCPPDKHAQNSKENARKERLSKSDRNEIQYSGSKDKSDIATDVSDKSDSRTHHQSHSRSHKDSEHQHHSSGHNKTKSRSSDHHSSSHDKTESSSTHRSRISESSESTRHSEKSKDSKSHRHDKIHHKSEKLEKSDNSLQSKNRGQEIKGDKHENHSDRNSDKYNRNGQSSDSSKRKHSHEHDQRSTEKSEKKSNHTENIAKKKCEQSSLSSREETEKNVELKEKKFKPDNTENHPKNSQHTRDSCHRDVISRKSECSEKESSQLESRPNLVENMQGSDREPQKDSRRPNPDKNDKECTSNKKDEMAELDSRTKSGQKEVNDNSTAKSEEDLEKEQLIKEIEALKRKLEAREAASVENQNECPVKYGANNDEAAKDLVSLSASSGDRDENKNITKFSDLDSGQGHKQRKKSEKYSSSDSESESESNIRLHLKSKHSKRKKSKHKKKSKKSKKKSFDKHKSLHKKHSKRSRSSSSSRSRSRSPLRKRHKSERDRSVSGSPKRKRRKSNHDRSFSPERKKARQTSSRSKSRSPKRKYIKCQSDKTEKDFDRKYRSSRSPNTPESAHKHGNEDLSMQNSSSEAPEKRTDALSRQSSRSGKENVMKHEKSPITVPEDSEYKHKHRNKRRWSTDSESSFSRSPSPVKMKYVNDDTNDSWAAKASSNISKTGSIKTEKIDVIEEKDVLNNDTSFKISSLSITGKDSKHHSLNISTEGQNTDNSLGKELDISRNSTHFESLKNKSDFMNTGNSAVIRNKHESHVSETSSHRKEKAERETLKTVDDSYSSDTVDGTTMATHSMKHSQSPLGDKKKTSSSGSSKKDKERNRRESSSQRTNDKQEHSEKSPDKREKDKSHSTSKDGKSSESHRTSSSVNSNHHSSSARHKDHSSHSKDRKEQHSNATKQKGSLDSIHAEKDKQKHGGSPKKDDIHGEKRTHSEQKRSDKNRSESHEKFDKHICDKESKIDAQSSKDRQQKENNSSDRNIKHSETDKHSRDKNRTQEKDKNAKPDNPKQYKKDTDKDMSQEKVRNSRSDKQKSDKSETKDRTDRKEKEDKSSKHSSRSGHKSHKDKDHRHSDSKKSDSGKQRHHREESKPRKDHKHNVPEPESFENMLCFDNSDAVSVSTTDSPKKAKDRYEGLNAKFKIKKKCESNTLGMGGKIQKPKFKRNTEEPEDSISPNKAAPDDDLKTSLPLTQAHYRPYRFGAVQSKKTVEDNEAPFLGQKTNTRTQVYSGKKQTGLTEMHSLFDFCIKVLQDNIDSIDYVGGIPLDVLKPVLEKCTPKQLYDLEDYNPHFLADSDYLWKIHCEREFRGSKPDEMETWRELYLRKFDEREEKFKSIKANISKQMATAAPARKTQMAYMDNVAKPPREVRRQQLRFGTSNTIQTKSGGGNSVKNRFQAVDMITLGREKQQQADKYASQGPMMKKTLAMMKNLYRR